MARPTKYKAEFAEQARKLCLLGATDAETAWFLEIDGQTLSEWKAMHPDFAMAMTPKPEEVEAYRARRALKGKRRAVARNAYRKSNPSVGDLMARLESQFKPGMTWDNYGKWHIDHIKPCALFNQVDDAEFAECWSLNNLQPLWASENVRKGATYGGA